MGGLSRWAVRKPWWALGAFLLFAAVIGYLGTAQKGTLNDSFSLPDTQSKTATDLLESMQGDSASAATALNATVIWSPESGTAVDEATAESVVPLLTRISELDGIACVTNPFAYAAQAQAAQEPTEAPAAASAPLDLGTDCPTAESAAPDLSTVPEEQQAQLQEALAAAAAATSPISADGRVAFSTISFTSADGTDVPVATAEAIVDEVKAANVDGLTIGASGQVLSYAGQEPPSSEGIGVTIALIILLIAFGSMIAAGLPLLTAGTGVALGGLLLYFVARFYDVATFAPTLASMIGLGVGIDYSLFVINRYRQAVHAGHEPKRAALEAVNTSGRAVVFAATTVIIALLGLWITGISFFNGLSLAASGTVLLVMLSAVWLLPALLSLLGHRAITPVSGLISHGLARGGAKRAVAVALVVLIWLAALGMVGSAWSGDQFQTAGKVIVTIAALGAAAMGTFGYRLTREHRHEREPWHPEGGRFAHYARLLQKAPLVPALLSLGLVVLLAIPALSLRLGFPDDSGRPEGSPARIAYDLTTEGFGAGQNGPFFVAVKLPQEGDVEGLGALVTALGQTEGVASTLRSSAMLPLLGQQLEGQTVSVVKVVPTTGPQDEATDELLTRLRDQTLPDVQAATDVEGYIGGTTAIIADFTTVLSDALPLFLVVVVGLGFVMLMILFRAPVVSLTAVVTSLLSFLASLGITVAVFQWGWFNDLLGVTGTGPIFPFLPVMVFAILFGLSMDYQVFLVSRMQEEWARGTDNAAAVRRGLAGSGRVVLMAALIMASVFGAFIPTPGNEIKLFGVSLTAAVLVDAFLIRLVFVPSFMSLLGRANWWLPGWVDRILPHFEVEAGADELTDDESEPDPEPQPASLPTA